ncbi:MAG: hypothetical protein LBE79_07855 [Tannerella sp.]|jgi:hypothetical protein|nr:hypothetical protein [Tannerella sp.]
MNKFFACSVPLAIGIFALLLIVTFVLYWRVRSVMQIKNRSISRWMYESVRFENELKKIRMENDLLNKTLDRFGSQSTVQSEMDQTVKNNKTHSST